MARLGRGPMRGAMKNSQHLPGWGGVAGSDRPVAQAEAAGCAGRGESALLASAPLVPAPLVPAPSFATSLPMPYQQILDHCFADSIGAQGLDRDEFQRYCLRAEDAVTALKSRRGDPTLPHLALPGREDDLRFLREVADRWRDRFRRVVVFGTGGSGLGALALLALRRDGEPVVQVEDNLDAGGLEHLLASDLSDTGFLCISKSGGTAETLGQTLAALAAVQGRDVAGRFLAIAEPGDNPLRRLAARHGIPVLDHDPHLGGRYSVLSLVGLLPALIAGLDAARVRAGAAAVLDRAFGAPESPVALGAALQVALADTRAVRASVLLPYDSRLDQFARWYSQLWAESLGKQGHGTTPIRSLGPVDQHSQLQLWLDGPADKAYTLILPDQRGLGPKLDVGLAGNDPALAYLAGRTIGDLAEAEGRATAETLARKGRPTRVIRVNQVDEVALGALFMHFQLETLIAAQLWEVDPFDQPAVEEGKKLTRAWLAGQGGGSS